MTLRRRIEAALRAKRGLDDTYVKRPEDNLLFPERASEVLQSLCSGSGGELTGAHPKFHSVGSSSALAVNSFFYWTDHIDELKIADHSGFKSLDFERKFTSGLGGTPPNPDVYLDRNNRPICVEAKFLEPLAQKKAQFNESYDQIADARTSSKWYVLYDTLKKAPETFTWLDAAQLVKHFFGITNRKHDLLNPQLAYVYWEPTDASRFVEYREHRDEVERLREIVDGDSLLGFLAIRYADLWNEWSELNPQAANHVERLRGWYEIALG